MHDLTVCQDRPTKQLRGAVWGRAGVTSRELIVLGISGVQRFIAESRRTADLAAGSRIVQSLALAAATQLRQDGAELVFPQSVILDGGAPSIPNRIVAVAPDGVAGEGLARAAECALRERWRRLVDKVSPGEPTPGFPEVRWVVAAGDDYAAQWRDAGRAFGSLKRSTSFEQLGDGDGLRGVTLCDLSPRWPALSGRPSRAKSHDASRLSAANWVKRIAPDSEEVNAFPSTRAIASAFTRQRLIDAVERDDAARDSAERLMRVARRADPILETRVSGLRWSDDSLDSVTTWIARGAGGWLTPEAWNAGAIKRSFPGAPPIRVEDASSARRALADLFKRSKTDRAPAYLALVMQDIDSLGLNLGRGPGSGVGPPTEHWHGSVSAHLSALAERHRQLLEAPELLATTVYSGGDDLVFLAPAQSALAAAKEVNIAVTATSQLLGWDVTASTAVVFFHQSSPFGAVLAAAHSLLDRAKASRAQKHALGVAFRRHSGSSREVIVPWDVNGSNAADVLAALAEPAHRALSPKLISDVDRDAAELDSLRRGYPRVFESELARLIGRHVRDTSATADLTARLIQLADWVVDGTSRVPLSDVLKIAHTIGQELS